MECLDIQIEEQVIFHINFLGIAEMLIYFLLKK